MGKPPLKALVTGGTGFIGSHLVEALIERGIGVRCLLRKSSDLKWISHLPLEYAWGDCRDRASLMEPVKGVDFIFHAAGATKAVREEILYDVNAGGTANLIRACLEQNQGVRKFVYLSSQAAAGPCRTGDRKKESDLCEPVSAYGRSKRRGEELALDHAGRLPLIILRPSAVYGPRERDIYVFLKFLSKGLNPCLSSPDQRLSLCYVRDVVQAALLAADAQTRSGEVFFISDGQEYSIESVGEAFARALGVRAFRFCLPRWLVMGMASFSEYASQISRKPALISRGKVEELVQKNWVCDITKAKTVLGFGPGTLLTEGARLSVDWYRRENWL